MDITGCKYVPQKRLFIIESDEGVKNCSAWNGGLVEQLIVAEGVSHVVPFGYKFPMLRYARLPSSLRMLEGNVFEHCRYLTEVDLGMGIKFIGEYSFGDCVSLGRIKIPASVQHIGYACFCDCKELFEVRIQNGVLGLEDCVFAQCRRLRELYLPSSVIRIDEEAFCGSSIQRITGNPGSVAESFAKKNGLDFWAVGGRVSIEGICGDRLSWAYDTNSRTLRIFGSGRMYDYGWKHRAPWRTLPFEHLVVEPGVESIGRCAFLCCLLMQMAELPDSLEEIDRTSFLGCEDLEDIRIEGSTRFKVDTEGRELEKFMNLRSIPVSRSKMKIRSFRKNGEELFSFPAPYDIV